VLDRLGAYVPVVLSIGHERRAADRCAVRIDAHPSCAVGAGQHLSPPQSDAQRGIRILPGDHYGFAWMPHGTKANDLQYFVDYIGMTPAKGRKRCAPLRSSGARSCSAE
jgi:hypothetical protein